MKRIHAVAGLVAVVTPLLLGSCSLVMPNKTTDEKSLDGAISRVRFDNGSGDVIIRGGDQPSITRTIHYRKDKPGVTHHVENGELVLETCKINNCSIDYDVVVPREALVEGKVGSGDATLSGLAQVKVDVSSGDARVENVAGDAKVKASSGTITAANVSGTSELQASSGDVEGRDLDGSTQVKASSGSVDLVMKSAQDVRVKANSGDVTLTVPRDAYRLKTDTGSGDVTSDVRNDDNGSHQLDLRTASGEIVVKQS